MENNGVSEARAYNTDNSLASISFSGASIGNLTYGWEAKNKKTCQTNIMTSCLPSPCIQGEGAGVRVCSTDAANSYDSEDRLVGFNRTSGLTQSWSLSAVGVPSDSSLGKRMEMLL